MAQRCSATGFRTILRAEWSFFGVKTVYPGRMYNAVHAHPGKSFIILPQDLVGEVSAVFFFGEMRCIVC